MHVGLIGGIGPAATDLYYRGLIERHAASGIPLELTIAHADAREMTRNLANNDPQRQADIFARLVDRLKLAGARAAAVTSMGGHFCVGELRKISSLPILDAIPEVNEVVRQRGFKKVGIIGTRMVMESRLYGGLSGVEVVTPEGEMMERVHSNYVEMAIPGRVTEEHRRTFFSVGRQLCRERNAEIVLLGGTDLFLAFAGQQCGFPVIDCAEAHIDAIYRTTASAN